MPRWIKFAGLAFLLLLLASVPLAKTVETGAIAGVVTNDFGPVARASIQAMNAMTGEVARAQSDAAGNYRLEELRAGRYSLWVQAMGNDSLWIHEVIVERGKTTRHDIHLGNTRGIPTGL